MGISLGRVLWKAAGFGDRALLDPGTLAVARGSSISFLVRGASSVTLFLRKAEQISWLRTESWEDPIKSFNEGQVALEQFFGDVAIWGFPPEDSILYDLTERECFYVSRKDTEPAFKTRTLIKFCARMVGFSAGMILAGVMDWAREIMAREELRPSSRTDTARSEKAENWIGFILGVASVAMGSATFVGPRMAAGVKEAAPLFVNGIKHRYWSAGDVQDFVLDLGPLIFELSYYIKGPIYEYVNGAHRSLSCAT